MGSGGRGPFLVIPRLEAWPPDTSGRGRPAFHGFGQKHQPVDFGEKFSPVRLLHVESTAVQGVGSHVLIQVPGRKVPVIAGVVPVAKSRCRFRSCFSFLIISTRLGQQEPGHL